MFARDFTDAHPAAAGRNAARARRATANKHTAVAANCVAVNPRSVSGADREMKRASRTSGVGI